MIIHQSDSQEYRFNKTDLPALVKRLWPEWSQKKVWALHGDLGAGKTTFTSALCQFLGTQETADSPTFSLINQYTFKDDKGQDQTIYHSDWYRLTDEEEARMAGIEEMLEDDFFLCLIEWSEHAPKLLPENQTIHLYFRLGTNPEERYLMISEEAK